ncbi:hypothetical protein CHARACLAT_016715 [Characodon lateralis]|uniref:Uncharacterized protein n=1 Tax=Characodon lateralis TaxID=208331 RepID=A0ABU7F415_9TELE|nr:hypothetical protein [Characodon lateralis]
MITHGQQTPKHLTASSGITASPIRRFASAVIACSRLLEGFNMLRENFKAWSNGSEAYSSDPEEDEEEEEDMVFGESDQDGMSAEMMDLSDLPTALFACSIHDVVFEQDVHRVRRCFSSMFLMRV